MERILRIISVGSAGLLMCVILSAMTDMSLGFMLLGFFIGQIAFELGHL